MPAHWLNLYFRYSGYTFKLKQKIVGADNWVVVIPYALLLIVSELGFTIISLPVYLMVPPEKVQEEGFILPKKAKERPQFQTYAVRRKVSLTTLGSAGGIFLLKILVVGFFSYLLFGIQQLLADSQDWTFDSSVDYIYDAAKVEVTGGLARLKDLGGTYTGANVNREFSTSTTGWTFGNWPTSLPSNTTASGAWNSGSGGHARITLGASRNNKTWGGYYQQAITVTANNANPDTATLSLDWSSVTYTAPRTPTSYRLYAFVDSASGAPSGTSTAVWSSAEIRSTTAWASSTVVDIKSKLPSAGTYYVKFAAYAVTGGSGSATWSLVSGFDNVKVDWLKASHSYATDRPTTTPTSSLAVLKAVSWNSFTETATKNGGEIYYQISPDNGTNWWYYNTSAWVTTTLATNYNTATQINDNISKFTTSTNQIKWRAYLSSDGTQQVGLDNIAIGYTQNQRAIVSALVPTQSTSTGYLHVNYNLIDAESDPSSLTAYEYSLNGTFSDAVTMTASTTDPNHSGITGLSTAPAGVGHTFVWDAKSQLGNVYNTGVYVRLRPNDGISNGNHTTSSVFTVDYVSSTVSNVSATQTIGSTVVIISYDLFDNTTDNITTELQISGDGGSTWTVPATSVVGAIGAGVTAGNGKTVSWNAGADYPNQQKSNLQVRIRAKDKFQNQGTYTASSNFSLDTLPPATLVTANLLAQPNAGDSTVLVGGSFTEANPNTNEFFVAINNGAYSATTTGDTDTAAPSNKNTNVGATLTGHDVITKVSITHTDDYGLSYTNENLSPSSSNKYVKPYTPVAPTLSNPVTTRLDLQINAHASEASDVEYAIFEATSSKYVQSDGTLGASPVWQVMGTGSGQWGNGLGVSGKVRVTGLSSPVANYIFKVKSRNPNDPSHVAASESAYSATAQISNTAPSIALNTYSQTTDGTQYVQIAYTGTDGQGDVSSLSAYEYSVDGSTWHNMTERSGVGSNGISNLVFLPTGSPYNFSWDSGVDAPNIETSTAKIRLKGNDTLANGSLTTSNNITIDNKAPVIANLTASQNSGAKTVAISYDLVEANNSLIQIEISSDNGSNWTVATTTLTGAVGAGVTPGSGKTVSWNAGVDFSGQYNTQMKVRVRARDAFGNQGSYTTFGNFVVDTHAPILTNAIAVQDTGADTFTFHYDVNEDLGNVTIALAISADDGSTWTVPITSATGNVGSGIATGTNKTITWSAGTDYNNQEKSAMQIRLTATDSFTNSSDLASANFNLDSQAPRIANVTAAQTLASTNVVIHYDLADKNLSNVALDISSNGGGSWVVTDTSVSGDIGAGVASGTSKTVTWNAGVDFSNQDLATMKVRVRSTDIYNNASGDIASSNFSLDTLPPAVNLTANLKAQPLAGDTSVLVGGSFTENNPNSNDFYVAINNGAYGSLLVGTINTATPADELVPVGATLKGNDYVSKVKIVHTDDYNQTVNNENLTPNSAYQFVKPYTPGTPAVYNPAANAVTVGLNKNPAEVDGLSYAIYEITSGKYVQSNGTLGTNPVWQIIGTGSVTEWGFYLASAGQVRVTGLTNPAYTYQFQVKSRNGSDGSHAPASDSNLSSSASSANQSPTVAIGSISQTTDGSKYVTINYVGTDLENETVSLIKYQYSTDNATWHNMTEKSGVGSDGLSGLAFSATGAAHDFMWDVGTDAINTEDDTVYIRLQANDGTTDGGTDTSGAFTIDTKAPVVASVTASQSGGSNNVAISYNLTEYSTSTIRFNVSADGGSNWTVATTTATGDLGTNIASGSGKSISWNPGVDYSGQEASNMKVQVGAIDSFGNQGSFIASSNFNVDTKAPVFANVAAAQVVSSSIVRITYDLSDANNSTVALDISSDGGSNWDVTDVSVSGAIGAGIASGTAKVINWDAGADFPNHQLSNMQVRLRAVDTYANATGNVSSNLFAINTQAPDITAVVVSQTLGSNNVSITYNLFDSDNVAISLDISSDGGSSWTVATSSATGAVGPAVVPGLAKAITWNAGVNYNNQENANMRVRLRGTNTYGNTGYSSALLGAFSIDSLAPATAISADLQAQPNAGDTSVSIGGSFTEANPNFNYFLVAINGGAYAATTTGEVNTAAPANQFTAIGTTLTGHDYISKVKITHLDDYGHFGGNENTSPTAAYQYVKPYTPLTPTVNNPQTASVDLTINPNASEASDVEYVIYETYTGKYVQANGSLGTSEVWKTLGTGAGQWGNLSGVIGKITVIGLVSPVASYSFMIKSRNPNDPSDALSSQSAYSPVAGITNSAPSLSITGASQSVSGGYVVINYTGTDAQNDTNSLTVYEYSTNGLSWAAMSEKSGVGSDGVSNLNFQSTGTAHTFVWDVATDLPNQEQATVYVRLRSTDGLTNSNLAVSSALATDTQGPVVTGLTMSQAPNSNMVTFGYDLADLAGSNNNVTLEISNNDGSTYVVPISTLTGNIGANVTAGANRSVTWDAGTDFNNQESNLMKIRIRATDRYGNVGDYAISGNFSVDTKGPVISGVAASQSAGSTDVVINYNLADNTPAGHLVEFAVSSNSGATWVVATSTRSGEIGAGQTTGAKSFTWLAGTDFTDQALATMRVQVRARDYFGNQGTYISSANFSLDTKAPVISGISASQTVGTNSIAISYDLGESATIALDISADGGTSWTVAKTALTGALGSVTAGLNKSVTWGAGTDFAGQENSTMRIRLRGVDNYGNSSIYYESADFSADTAAPLGLLALSKFASTASSVTLNWQVATDAHFNHFELWHGSSQSDVDNYSGTASQWSVGDDANLTNPLTISTVITGLTLTDNYYVKIWAIDDYGNTVTVPVINVYETVTPPVTPPTAATTGGGVPIVTDNVAPGKPILNPLVTPTRETLINLAGLAEPRSRVELYDNGILVGTLNSLTDNNGVFNQNFRLTIGNHTLTIRAIDGAGNVSQFSEAVTLNITTSAPTTPIILTPQNNLNITDATPQIIGVADANNQVLIKIDNNQFTVTADTNGAWNFILPTTFALVNGQHVISATASDQAGNQSGAATVNVIKVAALPVIPSAGVIISLPAVSLINEATGATELAGIPVPEVIATGATLTTVSDVLNFTGKSLPNSDVVVYIHSDQALVYRTRTDANGDWIINHSQTVAELTPGNHTIYAVALDANANVKSRPSAISSFVVKRNFWVMVFNYLNWQTTVATLAVLLLAVFWLYRVRKTSGAKA